MCGVFDQIAREEIRKRGDQFLAACNAFVLAANNMTVQLQKLNSLVESGRLDPKLFQVNFADIAKKSDDVAKAGNAFGKALREF